MIIRVLTPREILVGGGSRFNLPAVLGRIEVRRPIIVADPVMIKLGHAQALEQALLDQKIDCQIFSDIVEDPTDTSVLMLAEKIAAGGHDGLVALGGGSAIDTAKAAGIVAMTGEALNKLKIPRISDMSSMPLVAIPTTAGTGSEVSRAAVITDTGTKEKMLIVGTAALPAAAIVDYELTLTCPLRVTIDSGIDALTHGLEALVNRKGSPHAEALALSALRLIGANLETVVEQPENREAREAMMLGAFHAGLAMCSSSTALIHGMGRPIGAFFHVPHGMSNAMVLPLVTQFSLEAAPDKYAAAARALRVASEADSDKEAGEKLVAGFVRLNKKFNIPTPRAFGIDRRQYFDLVPAMVQQGLASDTPLNNPRLATEAEMKRLFELAYDGQLEDDRGVDTQAL